jgi:hypothetical protein
MAFSVLAETFGSEARNCNGRRKSAHWDRKKIMMESN